MVLLKKVRAAPFLTLLSIFVLLQGCATAKKSGFVDNLQQMKPGRRVERFRVNHGLLTPDTLAKIEIASIDTSKITDAPTIKAKEAADWLSEAATNAIQSRAGWAV